MLSDMFCFLGGSLEDGAKFTDPGICKSFLMGLCPYDLFHNTVTKVIIIFLSLPLLKAIPFS